MIMLHPDRLLLSTTRRLQSEQVPLRTMSLTSGTEMSNITLNKSQCLRSRRCMTFIHQAHTKTTITLTPSQQMRNHTMKRSISHRMSSQFTWLGEHAASHQVCQLALGHSLSLSTVRRLSMKCPSRKSPMSTNTLAQVHRSQSPKASTAKARLTLRRRSLHLIGSTSKLGRSPSPP